MNGADQSNPFFARLYHHVLRRSSSEAELRFRREALEGLRGTVVEVGPGNGPNFGHYRPPVERVVAVEPEPYLRRKAAEAAELALVRIEVVAGDAEHLPLADGEADAVVFAHVLCSVPDQGRALAEARRVLRPGGELRIFEHVHPEHRVGAAFLNLADRTFWPRVFGGCHPNRDTRAALAAAGYDVAGVRRLKPREGGLEPPLPHLLGRATLR